MKSRGYLARLGAVALAVYVYSCLSNQACGQIIDAAAGDTLASDRAAITGMLNDFLDRARHPDSCLKADYLTRPFIEDIEAEVQEQSSAKDRAKINQLLSSRKDRNQLAGLDWSFGARIQRYATYENGYEVYLMMSSSFGFAENEHNLFQDAPVMLLLVRESDRWKIADISDELVRLYLGCEAEGSPMVMYFSQGVKQDGHRGLTISFGTRDAAVVEYDLSPYQD